MREKILRRLRGYVVGTLLILLAWQLVALLVASPALPGPVAAIQAFVEHAAELAPHALLSTARIVVAMVVATLLAVPLGLAIGRSKKADAIGAPVLFLLHPIPKVVFLPVLLVLFGLGNMSKIVLIILIVFFQIISAARDAAKAVPSGVVLSVRSLGANRLDIARHVVFPAALPEIFTSLRIGAGTAVAVLFLAESIAGTNGLGWFIIDAWGLIDYPRMFAGVIAMGLLGIFLYEGLELAEAYATRWRKAGAA